MAEGARQTLKDHVIICRARRVGDMYCGRLLQDDRRWWYTARLQS